MAAHPHAALMAQYAEDAQELMRVWERWQVQEDATGNWLDLTNHPAWSAGGVYRRKPKTILINGIKVPEPLRGPLYKSQTYWLVRIENGKAGVQQCNNGIPELGLEHVKSGLVHLDCESALKHSTALVNAAK